jgi:hypothetical protein
MLETKKSWICQIMRCICNRPCRLLCCGFRIAVKTGYGFRIAVKILSKKILDVSKLAMGCCNFLPLFRCQYFINKLVDCRCIATEL